jgi:hypothetical protein
MGKRSKRRWWRSRRCVKLVATIPANMRMMKVKNTCAQVIHNPEMRMKKMHNKLGDQISLKFAQVI